MYYVMRNPHKHKKLILTVRKWLVGVSGYVVGAGEYGEQHIHTEGAGDLAVESLSVDEAVEVLGTRVAGQAELHQHMDSGRYDFAKIVRLRYIIICNKHA